VLNPRSKTSTAVTTALVEIILGPTVRVGLGLKIVFGKRMRRALGYRSESTRREEYPTLHLIETLPRSG
jgi:hypothetical protein